MSTKEENKYGCGKNPPYSLYQDENGKWGLVDKDGVKLPAVFDRLDENRFSCSPEEVVTFDEQEGFELLAWCDLSEVWFNFTFGNPAYPDDLMKLMWEKKPVKGVREYSDELHSLLPASAHWLTDAILGLYAMEEQLRDCEFDEWDEQHIRFVEQLLADHPEVGDAAVTNPMLDPVMRNNEVDIDIRKALWRGKLNLDDEILGYNEGRYDTYDE